MIWSVDLTLFGVCMCARSVVIIRKRNKLQSGKDYAFLLKRMWCCGNDVVATENGYHHILFLPPLLLLMILPNVANAYSDY